MKFFRQRQLEREIYQGRSAVIQAFYPATEDGKTELRLPPPETLFISDLTTGNTPRFRAEVWDGLDRTLLSMRHKLPNRVALVAPSQSACAPEALDRMVEQNLRLRLLELLLASRRARRQCAGLVLGGVALLGLSYGLDRLSDNVVLFDMVNILGSLLIWTAGEKIFLDQAENRMLRRRYAALLGGRGALN